MATHNFRCRAGFSARVHCFGMRSWRFLWRKIARQKQVVELRQSATNWERNGVEFSQTPFNVDTLDTSDHWREMKSDQLYFLPPVVMVCVYNLRPGAPLS